MSDAVSPLSEGLELFKEGKFEEAAARLQDVVLADPSNIQARGYLGAAYARAGKPDLAVKHFKAVTDMDSKNPSNFFNLGQAYEAVKDAAKATAAYQQTLQIDPRHDKARARLTALGGSRPIPPSAPAPGMQPPQPTQPMPPARPIPTQSMPPQAGPAPGIPPQRPMPPAGAAPTGAYPPQQPPSPYGPPPSAYGPPPGAYSASPGMRPAVPIYNQAGFWPRVAAMLIDGLLLGIIAGIIIASSIANMASTMPKTAPVVPSTSSSAPGSTGAPTFSSSDEAAIVSAATKMQTRLLVVQILGIIYFIGMTGAFGATLGKMALGLRIIKYDGSKMGFGTAIGRYLLQTIFANLTCGLAYLAVAFNAERRGWHDQVIGTQVIHTR